MEKIFISHPLSCDIENNLKKVDVICKELNKNPNILPISPLHLFKFFGGSDKGKREHILDFCYDMIDVSDKIYIIFYDAQLSDGQLKEYSYSVFMEYRVKPIYLSNEDTLEDIAEKIREVV